MRSPGRSVVIKATRCWIESCHPTVPRILVAGTDPRDVGRERAHREFPIGARRHRNMKRSREAHMKNVIERRLFVQGGLAAVSGLIPSARAAEATDPADLTLEAASEL